MQGALYDLEQRHGCKGGVVTFPRIELIAACVVLDAVCALSRAHMSTCRYKAGKDNAGSASAVCLLTAQSLREALGAYRTECCSPTRFRSI